MEILLYSIIIFFVLQFILFKYTKLYDVNLLTRLYDYAWWVNTNPKIIIMGSSHAKSQIVPSDIVSINPSLSDGDVVNIGEGAACPFSNYIAFQKRKHIFKNTELVYITLDPHMLSEKYSIYTDYEKKNITYLQWLYFTTFHKKFLTIQHKNKYNYFFPIVYFINSLRFKRQFVDIERYGYTPLAHKEYNLYSSGKVSKYIYHPLEIFPVSEFQISYLKKLKEELNSLNTKVIFLLTPSYSWSKYYEKEAIEFDKKLIESLNKHIGKSSILGSLHSQDFDLIYEDFNDETHLAYTGATKFTKNIFRNIFNHLTLMESDFINLFKYRFNNNDILKNYSILSEIHPAFHTWKTPKTGMIEKKSTYVKFNIIEVENPLFFTHFPLIENVDMIMLDLDLNLPNVLSLTITLRHDTEFAHFFIETNLSSIDKLYLYKDMISQKSENFDFNTINFFALRLKLIDTSIKSYVELKQLIFYRSVSGDN